MSSPNDTVAVINDLTHFFLEQQRLRMEYMLNAAKNTPMDWSKMIFMKSDLSLYVKVPAPAIDLQIERAKILWMLIRHHGVQVKQEEWIATA